MTAKPIPNAILDTQKRLGRAMLEEEDRTRRNLLASAKASIDWLLDHLTAAQDAYAQIRAERNQVP